MPESLELLLSDEFVEFSTKIADVYNRRKAKQEEIQALFSKAKTELSQIELEAKTLADEWEKYKNSIEQKAEVKVK